jgi:hypothetical protein
MNAAAPTVVSIGVKVRVPAKRAPTTIKIELQRELDRIRRSLAFIEERLEQVDDDTESSALAPDACVDQRSVPAPRDLYLRLARQGAFPSKKHGKRIVARWADVRRALLETGPGLQKGVASHAEFDEAQGDDLDGLRRRLGFVGKGR